MKYYTVGEFAKLIGKNPQTLREWDKKNILKPHHVITVFSSRLQGKRANKAKKMIKELLEDDNVNEGTVRT